MTADGAAVALRRLASGLSIAARHAAPLRRLGFAVDYLRAVPMSRRWITCVGITRAGARWLGAYDGAPFGIELPENTSGAARRAVQEGP